jgi:glycine cleavage system pyridoxal-binding protein P
MQPLSGLAEEVVVAVDVLLVVLCADVGEFDVDVVVGATQHPNSSIK